MSYRYEFTNKGADIFIEALARLNYLLKQAGTGLSQSVNVTNKYLREAKEL
jgi:hypothetical protein